MHCVRPLQPACRALAVVPAGWLEVPSQPQPLLVLLAPHALLPRPVGCRAPCPVHPCARPCPLSPSQPTPPPLIPQVDSSIKAAWANYEKNSEFLAAAVEKQRALHAANLEQFQAARQAYLAKVEESVAFVKEQGLQVSAGAGVEARVAGAGQVGCRRAFRGISAGASSSGVGRSGQRQGVAAAGWVVQGCRGREAQVGRGGGRLVWRPDPAPPACLTPPRHDQDTRTHTRLPAGLALSPAPPQGTAKAATEVVLSRVADAKKAPAALLHEIDAAWHRLLALPAVAAVLEGSRKQVGGGATAGAGGRGGWVGRSAGTQLMGGGGGGLPARRPWPLTWPCTPGPPPPSPPARRSPPPLWPTAVPTTPWSQAPPTPRL